MDNVNTVNLKPLNVSSYRWMFLPLTLEVLPLAIIGIGWWLPVTATISAAPSICLSSNHSPDVHLRVHMFNAKTASSALSSLFCLLWKANVYLVHSASLLFNFGFFFADKKHVPPLALQRDRKRLTIQAKSFQSFDRSAVRSLSPCYCAIKSFNLKHSMKLRGIL